MAAGRSGQGHESHSQGRHQTKQRPLPLKLSAPSSPEKGSKFYLACPPGQSRLFGPHAASLWMDGRVCHVSQGCITQHQAGLGQQGIPLSWPGGIPGPLPLPWTLEVCFQSWRLLGLWTHRPALRHLPVASPCVHLCVHQISSFTSPTGLGPPSDPISFAHRQRPVSK